MNSNAPFAPRPLLTADALLGILRRNPDVQLFSVERIVAALGPSKSNAAWVRQNA